MEYIIFLLLGIATGIFGTLLGVGGGLVLVPVFIMFMSEGGVYPYFTTAAEIVGTSLFVVLTNAVSGTLAYIRQGRVFFHAAIPFALATLPGAFLGSYIVDKFDATMLDLYFGCFLLVMAVIMYANAIHTPKGNMQSIPKGFSYNRPVGVISSFFVGFLSSMFGIGGGIIHVPLMTYILGFPVHVSTATSQFVLACSSFVGIISHILLAHVIWLPAICIGIGATIGAQLGAKISRKTRSKVILILLSCAIFATGLKLILMSQAQ